MDEVESYFPLGGGGGAGVRKLRFRMVRSPCLQMVREGNARIIDVEEGKEEKNSIDLASA